MPLPKMTRPTSVSDREDRELVGRCLNGESEAWEALIQRHRRLIYSVPVSFRLQPADADEVFQRTVIKLLDHLAQLRERGALPGWLKSVARRECLDLKRRSRGSTEVPVESIPLEADQPAIDDRLELVERDHLASLALASLAEPCRSLLQMLYVEQPTPGYEEVARRLGRPIGSLGPTRGRCVDRLRREFQRLWDQRAGR